MPFLEKAFAKLNQNYERLMGNSVHMALRTLSAMPVINIEH